MTLRRRSFRPDTNRSSMKSTAHTWPGTEASVPGQVWAVDFMEDRLVSGRKLRLLNVMDIYSRYALDSLVEHSITGELAARHLEGLFRRFGAPRVLRRDHGPEFESKVFKRLLSAWRVQDEPVPKGQPYDLSLIH